VKILLDTCEFLWLISGDPKLSLQVLSRILDTQNSVLLSTVSFWEISVKHGLGKLVLPEAPSSFVTKQRELHRIESLGSMKIPSHNYPGCLHFTATLLIECWSVRHWHTGSPLLLQTR